MTQLEYVRRMIECGALNEVCGTRVDYELAMAAVESAVRIDYQERRLSLQAAQNPAVSAGAPASGE